MKKMAELTAPEHIKDFKDTLAVLDKPEDEKVWRHMLDVEVKDWQKAIDAIPEDTALLNIVRHKIDALFDGLVPHYANDSDYEAKLNNLSNQEFGRTAHAVIAKSKLLSNLEDRAAAILENHIPDNKLPDKNRLISGIVHKDAPPLTGRTH